MDTYLFFLINHGLQNNVFDIMMPFITHKGYIFFIAVVIPLFFKDWRKGILVSTICILGFFAADKSVDILKNFFARPRPYSDFQNVRLIVGRIKSFSFPSAHAATSFAIATIIIYFIRWAAVPVIIIAALVAFSRIYVGVHYPSDVIGGAVWGGITGGGILLFYAKVRVYFIKGSSQRGK